MMMTRGHASLCPPYTPIYRRVPGAAQHLKGVHARLRGLWWCAADTDLGFTRDRRLMCASRVNPTCVDRPGPWRDKSLVVVEQSPPQRKKAAQQGRRFGFADAAIDFRPMQASRRREVAHAVLDCATLWVGGAVIEAPNTGERDRRRAHGAGLERDIEIALGKPLAAQRLRRRADRHHLRMRRRVSLRERPVAGLRDHLAVADDDAADRHLAGLTRHARLLEGGIHEALRWHGPFSHRHAAVIRIIRSKPRTTD